MDKIRAEIEKDIGSAESRPPRLPTPPDPDRSRIGELLRKYHAFLVVPGVLAAAALLAGSDRVWTIRGRSRHGPGASLAESTIWMVAICLAMYFGGSLLARIGAMPRLGMRAPDEAQIGCAGMLIRVAGLVLLYGWIAVVVGRLR